MTIPGNHSKLILNIFSRAPTTLHMMNMKVTKSVSLLQDIECKTVFEI